MQAKERGGAGGGMQGQGLKAAGRGEGGPWGIGEEEEEARWGAGARVCCECCGCARVRACVVLCVVCCCCCCCCIVVLCLLLS